jgi:hypothetical protein
MEIPNLSEPAAIIGETVAGRAAVVKKELAGLVSEIRESTFDMAELLSEVKGAAYYSAWGFESFADYVTAELDMKVRKAQYLVRIVQVCAQVGVMRKTYEPIGVSKLREITSLEPTESFWNAETSVNEPLVGHIIRLITKADEMTLQEVIDEVKRLKGLTGDDELVWMNFSVKRAVREGVVLPAIELAKQKLGSAGRDNEGQAIEYSDGAAIEVICADFSADPNNYTEESDDSQAQTEPTEESNGTSVTTI